MENVAGGEQGLALQQLLDYLKIQIVIMIDSHSLMPRVSHMAVVMFLTRFFHFWHSLSCSP